MGRPTDKFLHLTDLHCSDYPNHGWFLWPVNGDWRATETWSARLEEALDEAVRQSCDLLVMTGDQLDQNRLVKTKAQSDADWVAQVNSHAFTSGGGEVAAIPGNHEAGSGSYDGDHKGQWNDWETNVVSGLTNHVSMDGTLRDATDSNNLLGYYFDRNGIRYVFETYLFDAEWDRIYQHPDIPAWLVGLGGSLPIIHFRHLASEFYSTYDVDMPGEMQLMINGHDHRGHPATLHGSTDIIRYVGSGSVRATDQGNVNAGGVGEPSWTPTAEHGSHQLIEVEMSAYQGTTYPRAQIITTGFKRARTTEVVDSQRKTFAIM